MLAAIDAKFAREGQKPEKGELQKRVNSIEIVNSRRVSSKRHQETIIAMHGPFIMVV